MIIKHTDYSAGVHNIEFTENCTEIGLEEPFFGKVKVNCKMDKSIYQIVLNINGSSQVKYECDRCNEEFISEISTEFQLVCLFNSEDVQNEDINVIYLSPEQDKINISNDVKEYFVLNVPMKKVCKPECKGLCAKCSANLNLKKCGCEESINNPVWEPLQKLKGKLNNN